MTRKRMLWTAIALGWTIFMAGCVQIPPPADLPLETRYLVTHYYATAQNRSDAYGDLDSLRAQLASKAWSARRQPQLPATLPGLRAYRTELSAPIQIDAAHALAKYARLSASRRRQIADYYRRSDRGLTVDGAKHHPEWSTELDRIDQQIEQVQTIIRQRMQAARGRFEAGAHEDADRLFAEAVTLDPDNTENATEYTNFQQRWMSVMAEAEIAHFETSVQPALARYRLALRTDTDLNATLIKPIHSALDDARSRIVQLRTKAGEQEAFQEAFRVHDPVFRNFGQALAECRAETWSGLLRILFLKKDYWQANERLQKFMGARRIRLECGTMYAFSDLEWMALTNVLRKRYAELLPAAIQDLNEQANRARVQRLLGLALTIGRIGTEMIEAAGMEGVTETDRLSRLARLLDNTINTVRSRLHDELRRTVIVPRFQSTGGEGVELSRLLLDSLSRTVATIDRNPAAATVWGVGVATNATAPNTLGFDYRLTGRIEPIHVDTLPPRNLRREEVEFGRSITRRSNPDRRAARDFPMLYSQQVWVYERILNRYAKRAVLRAVIDLEHAGDNKSVWIEMDTVFGEDQPLDGVVMADDTEEWQRAAIRTVESTRRADMIEERDLPLDRAANLSPDRTIHRAILDHAAGVIQAAVIREATFFPIMALLRAERLPSGERDQLTANTLGLCLEYALLLARAVPSVSSSGTDSWIKARNIMADHLQRHCSPIWRTRSKPADEIMQGIWSRSRDATLAYLESQWNE